MSRRAALGVMSSMALLPVTYGLSHRDAESMPPTTQPQAPPPMPPAAPRNDALKLPPRPAGAMPGSQFVKETSMLSASEREDFVLKEILSGNVPEFLRRFVPVELIDTSHRAQLWVLPDYLALGSDDDFLRVPMRPTTAQRIADATGCALPTPKIVDAIYAQAAVKLTPTNLPTFRMASSEAFAIHQQHVAHQEHLEGVDSVPRGKLMAGHKKDVVLTTRLAIYPDHVAIYGWHRKDGRPVQPLCLDHNVQHVDYSHGIRLVRSAITLDGAERHYEEVLGDPTLASIVSREGPIRVSRYSTS